MKQSTIHWTLASLCAFCWIIGACTLSAQAQTDNWLWVKTTDSVNGRISPTSITSDLEGNTYIAGSFQGHGKFGDITLISSGSDDAFLMKYNRKGEVVWAQKFGSTNNETITGIAMDGSGNLFAVGNYLSDTLKIGWMEIYRSSLTSIFVARFSPNGDLSWVDAPKAVGRSSSSLINTVSSISVTALGDIYITGSYQSLNLTFGDKIISKPITPDTLNNINLYVAKYNSGGDAIWAKEFGNEGEDIGKSVTTDLDGNCYLGGTFNGSKITFGTSVFTNTVTTPSTTDFFVLKFSPTGIILWAKHGTGLKFDDIRAVKTDISGNCYITGTFRSSKLTVDNLTLDVYGLGAGYVIKFSTDGSVLWGKSFGGQSEEIGTGISFDQTQNAYVTGSFRSDLIVFNPLVEITNNGDIFTADIFIAKFSPTGDVLSAVSGGSMGTDAVAGITVDADGQFLIAGSAPSDTLNFGDKKATATSIKDNTSGGSTNLFVAKYGNGAVDVKEESFTSSSKVIVFPQPVIRTLNFRFTLEQSSPVTVEVIDILGNCIASIEDMANSGDNRLSCQFNAPSGIYFYNVKSTQTNLHGMFQVVR
ncbi:MAG: T9SS type A sorting domain-containing protein [Bacteroidetes bacterium]|nr:T9SS type A sorting domain-containing protein [Bacteroidota bacterium]